jgi:hypothetical protein
VGIVREDYSADGDAWRHFLFDHALLRAYRWSEDGLAGLTDREQRLCFALRFGMGATPILKQRIFGLSGPEGNHGEDPKELLVVSRSDADLLLAALALSLSQAEFPYERLRQENAKRTREQPEFELLDSGAFDGDRYWQITAEYAKAASDGSHHRSQHGARARRAPLVPQPMAFPNLSFVTCPTRRPRW